MTKRANRYGEYIKLALTGEGDTASLAIHLAASWTRDGRNLALIDMTGGRAYLADESKLDILQLGKESPFPEYREYSPESLVKIMTLISERGYKVIIVDAADIVHDNGVVSNEVIEAIIGLPIHVIFVVDNTDGLSYYFNFVGIADRGGYHLEHVGTDYDDPALLAYHLNDWLTTVEPLAYDNGSFVPDNPVTMRIYYQFQAGHNGEIPASGDELREWSIEVE